jgi:hypothetical protein
MFVGELSEIQTASEFRLSNGMNTLKIYSINQRIQALSSWEYQEGFHLQASANEHAESPNNHFLENKNNLAPLL